jgi:3-phosphoshikimate 1-carboxyvinyltransferase
MAMSLALAGLRVPNVEIRDPACVSKSYPRFWEEFSRLENATV